MSKQLTHDDKIKVLKLLEKGLFQHEIAAIFDVNQGRISEVKNNYVLTKSGNSPSTQLSLI